MPLLSLCMIVRNEEKNLARCLASVRGAVDEIIVVDTGSTDGTAQLARSLGAQVFSYEWQDDFAAARNASLAHAHGDWVLVLDADEELAPGHGPRLRTLLAAPQYDWYFLECLTFLGGPGHPEQAQRGRVLRLFRRGIFKYWRPIHEQVVSSSGQPNTSPSPGDSGAVILHHGYEEGPESTRKKNQRYVAIISHYLASHPDDALLHQALASSYIQLGDLESALRELYAAHDIWGAWTSKLLLDAVQSLRALGRYEESLELLDQGFHSFPDYTDLYFAQGLLALDLERPDLAAAAFQECLRRGEAPSHYTTTPGVGSYLAEYNLGVIAEVMGRIGEAEAHYSKALALAPHFHLAAERLATLPAAQKRCHKLTHSS